MVDRQLDITWTNTFFELPKNVPGRLQADDFVNFIWPRTLSPNDYTVVVESLDTAGPTFRSIGKLNKQVELPHVIFPARGRIGVVPNVATKPEFVSMLVRGGMYIIPDTKGRNGIYRLPEWGNIAANNN
jgi:hypothetical protein